jgi:hypothetical protein
MRYWSKVKNCWPNARTGHADVYAKLIADYAKIAEKLFTHDPDQRPK